MFLWSTCEKVEQKKGHTGERSRRQWEGKLVGFIMGHSRHQALALIDLSVVQRAEPRGPLEGSLGCKYNGVFLLHLLDRHTDTGGSDGKKGDRGKRESNVSLFLPFALWSYWFLIVRYLLYNLLQLFLLSWSNYAGWPDLFIADTEWMNYIFYQNKIYNKWKKVGHKDHGTCRQSLTSRYFNTIYCHGLVGFWLLCKLVLITCFKK